MGFSKRITLFQAVTMAKKGLSLPYSIDFTALSDGPLPAEWQGGNFEISSGAAINTPTLGAELTTNGDFSAWSGGLPTGWNHDQNDGSNYVEENPAGQAHFIGDARLTQGYGTWPVSQFLHTELESKAVVAGDIHWGFGWTPSRSINSVKVDMLETYLTSANAAITIDGQPGSDVTVDNISVKAISGVMALLPASQANATVKIVPETGSAIAGSFIGVIGRADSQTNPQNFIMVIMQGSASSYGAKIFKVLSGVWTDVTGGVMNGGPSTAIELRMNGTSVIVYGGVSKIWDSTIDEAAINNNKFHGIVSINGGNRLDSFFLTPPA